MKLAVAVTLVVVLLKDAFGASAKGNSLPLLRKYARNKDTGAGIETRGFFSIYKPTKRPTKANIIFVSSPTGTTSSEEEPEDPFTPPSSPTAPSEPSWPSWPSWHLWPSHPSQNPTTTTTTTTPKPTIDPEYPHFLPFLPPLLLPVPGWTGHPPPPFIPPKYPYHPHPSRPRPPIPPIVIDNIPSSPGTPTFAADETINDGGDDGDDDGDDDEGDLLVFPLPADFNVNDPNKRNPIKLTPEILAALTGGNRVPQPDKKQKPNKRRKPTTPRPIRLEGNSDRNPRPTKRRTPIKKLTTMMPMTVQLPQKQLAIRKKPKPSRKPRPKPTAKPIQVAEVPSAVEESSAPVEDMATPSPNRRKTPPRRKSRPRPQPTTKAPVFVKMPPTPVEEDPTLMDGGSGDSDGEPQPQTPAVPEQTTVAEPEKSEQTPASQTTSDVETVEAENPAHDDDDLTSEELLGPEKDLIVVQRKGKPMEAKESKTESEAAQIAPWQLLKLPRDAEWERGPELRSTRPRYVFYG